MNIIIKIILLNILLFITLKYSLVLFIILLTLLSFWIIYMIYKVNKIFEGNIDLDTYKMNFLDILNADIKTSYKEDILYDSILNNFTKLIKLMDKSEDNIPPNQMCKGELGDWTNCTKECGRGKKTRRFNVKQKGGKTGIDCIYEDGQIESSECFERLCKFNEECEYDYDCLSGLCSARDKLCTYPHICARDQLYNCNFEQCQELETKYGGITYDLEKQECINKSINIKFKKFEINEETIDSLVGVKEEEKEANKKTIINDLKQSKDSMCDRIKEGKQVSNCSENEYDSIYCENKYTISNDHNIPCYTDMNGSCISVSERNNEKYGDFTLDELYPDLDLEDGYWYC